MLTNMWPTPEEPAFGSFVAEQAAALERAGAMLDVQHFDGRQRAVRYAEAALAVRRRVHETRPDLVHAHYGLTGAVALAQRQVPVVTTFHGSDTGYVPWQRRVSRMVARRSTPIFVDRYGADRLEISNPTVIPCGVDMDLFMPLPRAEARAQLGWDQNRRYVLFPSGRNNAVKDPELFAATMARVVRAAPGVEAVYLAGFSRNDVTLVMNAADVMLVTSLSEGSPTAPKEALACQTPVVSVDVGGLRSLLADLPGCSVQPREPAALTEAVVSAFTAERSPRLRDRAAEFSQTRTAERILSVYRSTLEAA